MSSPSTPKAMVPGVPRRVVRLCKQSQILSAVLHLKQVRGGMCLSRAVQFCDEFCNEFVFLIAIFNMLLSVISPCNGQGDGASV